MYISMKPDMYACIIRGMFSGISRVGLRVFSSKSRPFKWLVKVGASKCAIPPDLKKRHIIVWISVTQ